MTTSLLLAGVALGAFLLAAGGAWLVARRTPRRYARQSMHRKMWFLIACGVAAAAYAFWTTTQLNQTTLHEAIVDGAPGEAFPDGGVVRRVDFSVEHPRVEHELLIGPTYRTPSLQRPSGDVRIEAIVARADDPPLLSNVYTFAPRFREPRWDPAYLRFTPIADGPHTLTLRLLTPDIPAIHVRIADPLKTDGKRITGY